MKAKYIMIHHSAVSYKKNNDQFIAINNYHKEKWGCKSELGYFVGYTYFISKMGRIYQARKVGEKTIACYQNDMNNGECIHIGLNGNFDEEKPFAFTLFGLKTLLNDLVKKHGIKKERIFFHRQFANKTCPGKYLSIQFVRDMV